MRGEKCRGGRDEERVKGVGKSEGRGKRWGEEAAKTKWRVKRREGEEERKRGRSEQGRR